MGVSVGTIFKWFNPDLSAEPCEDGQCVGIVTDLYEGGNNPNPVLSVKWWEMCTYHHEVDPNGTGPFNLEYIWQIGQLY